MDYYMDYLWLLYVLEYHPAERRIKWKGYADLLVIIMAKSPAATRDK